MRSFRAFCAVLAAAVIVTAAPAMAEDWPMRPVTVVSPFASGSTYDLIAHTVLDQVGHLLGQPFNLENRPGGDGTAGVLSVVKAAPDGYTFLLSSSAMSAAVILHKSLPYDTLRDLEPVAMFGGAPSILVVTPTDGFQDVADLVAAARAKPGKLKFGSIGVGSAPHLAGERFRLAAGIDVVHKPYPGPVEALADLAAGRLDFYFLPVAPALPLIKQGKVAPLAVSTPERLQQQLPNVPTLAESRYPVAPYLLWCGLSAPANTPRDIVNKLNAAVEKALNINSIWDKFAFIGVRPMPMIPERYAKFIADDVAATIQLGKDAHIEPTN